MLPTALNMPKRKPLSDAERDHLVPLFIDAQTTLDNKRVEKERETLKRRAARRITNAKTERDGFLWLLDHAVKTSNVIYYSHTQRFNFGWRKPLSAEERSALLDVITEFPYPYDIQCDDGRTLSGER